MRLPFNARPSSFNAAATIGIPIALLFGYQIILGLAPWLADISPWGFLFGAGSPVPPIARVALGQSGWPTMPIMATIGWCVLFTIVALWRFGREEFWRLFKQPDRPAAPTEPIGFQGAQYGSTDDVSHSAQRPFGRALGRVV